MNIPREFSHPVPIGRGSFSSVFRVYQRRLERHVVLKVIPIKNANDAAGIEKEAHVLASMRLPSVPRVYDVIRFRQNVIIVMEWVRGVPLTSLMELSFPEAILITLASSIVRELTMLHTSNVVHRDLKPQNIMATPRGNIVFVDFAFSISENTGRPFFGLMQGTPAYMAPELWSCQNPVDYKKADLFALGVILKNLLGQNFPEFAVPLISADPASRPMDCGVFEKEWRTVFPLMCDPDAMRKSLEPVEGEYTARLLLAGARELHNKGRVEEAYALITESLEAWPDNPEALDFLQNRYSTPIRTRSVRQTALVIAAVFAALVACVTAYILGTRSSYSRDFSDIQTPAWDADDRHAMRLTLPRGAGRVAASPSIALREIAPGIEVMGTVVIVVPERNGTLLIDGSSVSHGDGQRAAALLIAGTHRIEWIDSTAQRTWGETIELLPFESITISFARFIDGT